jgi:hypothetical protein
MELTELIQQIAYILYNFIAFTAGLFLGYIIAKMEP